MNYIAAELTKAWSKYDKNITAVLRTLGFNSVKAFNESNSKKEHYFALMKELKAKPEDGALGIERNLKRLNSSKAFKSLVWIENNVSNYMNAKDGSKDIDRIGKDLEKYFIELGKLPCVEKVSVDVNRWENDQRSYVNRRQGMIDKDQNGYISIMIEYDSTINVFPQENDPDQTPYTISPNSPISQTFTFKIPTSIDRDMFKEERFSDLLRVMFSKESFRESFKFGGPCMYTPNDTSGYTSGCLGSRSEEYQDVIESGSLEAYVVFITTWATTYVKGVSHPHRNLNSLFGRNYNFYVNGFQDMRAVLDIMGSSGHDNTENFCGIANRLSRNLNSGRGSLTTQATSTIKGVPISDICKDCVLSDTCLVGKRINKVDDKEAPKLDSKNKEMLLSMVNVLIDPKYKDMPPDAKHALVIQGDEYLASGYDTNDPMYIQYMDTQNLFKKEN